MLKTLPKKSYLIQKLQTNLTQILHKIRIRPFASSHKLADISVPPKDFQQDTEVAIQHDDLFAMAWQVLYQEHPTHPESGQPPEPELIPSLTEKDNTNTHPSPSSPDLTHEPESISNYPGNQADETTLDIADEPEDNTPVPKSPRKSHYNLRKNPTSNSKPDYAYHNALEANSTNLTNPNKYLDDDPELQVLADLGLDGGLRSENYKRPRH